MVKPLAQAEGKLYNKLKFLVALNDSAGNGRLFDKVLLQKPER